MLETTTSPGTTATKGAGVKVALVPAPPSLPNVTSSPDRVAPKSFKVAATALPAAVSTILSVPVAGVQIAS